MSDRKLYVGNLPGDIREWEVEDLFYKYGSIVDIDLRIPPQPPGYCFIEFEDARDAEDAIRGRDGYSFGGHKLRVELAHGGRGLPSSGDHCSDYGASGGRGGRIGGRGGVYKRSDYRVIVNGLPSSASWQDLKDHMRQAGDVCFSQVFRDGNGLKVGGLVPFPEYSDSDNCTIGIVDYTNYEDMKYAIRKLDDSEFRNPFARSYIRVKCYESSSSVSRSCSRSYSRSRSRSRSSSRNYSHTQSRRKNRSRSWSQSQSTIRSQSRSHRSISRSRIPPDSARCDQSPSQASSSD